MIPVLVMARAEGRWNEMRDGLGQKTIGISAVKHDAYEVSWNGIDEKFRQLNTPEKGVPPYFSLRRGRRDL